MSEQTTLQEPTHICDECKQPVQMETKEYQGLILACGCQSRSVKVKKAIPFAWQNHE